MLEDALRHRGVRGVSRILNDHHAAVGLDGHGPLRAVVEVARQHDGDGVLPVGPGRASEERIDGRAVVLLARVLSDVQAAVPVASEAMISRSNGEDAWL